MKPGEEPQYKQTKLIVGDESLTVINIYDDVPHIEGCLAWLKKEGNTYQVLHWSGTSLRLETVKIPIQFAPYATHICFCELAIDPELRNVESDLRNLENALFEQDQRYAKIKKAAPAGTVLR